ncbi:MAG: c-type cytochrome [Candidatus Scalinduaceae bacterium]
MNRPFLNVVIFTFVFIGSFVYLCGLLSRISGESASIATIAGISPEAGESIFWGKGKCHTCHQIGPRGSAVRCPNLENVAERALERVEERAKQGKPGMTATDYIVESISFPNNYVVDGFKGEMPFVYEPPISLNQEEIMAVITYLQTQGGESDQSAIKIPEEVVKKISAGKGKAVAWAPYMEGDPEVGESLFFDTESRAGCAKCHTVKEKGAKIGPELTTVAGTRTAQFLVESILKPSAVIASGFEPYLVITTDGEYITGVKKSEDEEWFELADQEGEIIEIHKDDIETIATQTTSIMPDFSKTLNMEEFHNILSFLLRLQ